ncbi:hypothetical protein MLC52_05390 [Sulfurimonas sp. NW15]|uniref:hypothetical protein n=1 Tax=Sulfurimonas sp. NW15 TaxID=2922729 RepID=UPI003DA8AA14
MKNGNYYKTVIKGSWIYNLWVWADKYKIDNPQKINPNWGEIFEPEYRGIPRDKELLIQMRHLDLSNYNLREIPDDIVCMENLKWINISGNSLENFPLGILNYEFLESINISENIITFIPSDLKYLKNLHRIISVGNNLKNIDEELKEKMIYTLWDNYND